MSASEFVMPASTPVAIRAQSLYKGYGLQLAVDGLSLEVPRGSFFGFLGANGAGKSTTIRMLTGLIPPDSGTIEILGFQMPKDELEIKRRIGLVPDESMLFDRLTGMEFLEFAGRMYGLARPTAIDRAPDLMKDILLDQVRRGATIFLTSHVLEVVERLCDRVAIIDHGRIVTCGSMEELRAGGESLEDAFVRIVGAEHHRERLDWL